MNQRPPGYEPDELPDCSTPRYIIVRISEISKWAEVDSNHRSNLQQIYSLSPLATRESIHEADDRTRTDNLLITNQLLCQLSHIGINGTNRARTYDPLLVRQMLSQLSYDPIFILLTTPAGLEPATSAVTGRRSNQLSHEAIYN